MESVELDRHASACRPAGQSAPGGNRARAETQQADDWEDADRIEGFDLIAKGACRGAARRSSSGTSGSAKTVFAAQFLAAGICKAGEPGVFVTFEESPEDIRRNMYGFGWDIAAGKTKESGPSSTPRPNPGSRIMVAAATTWRRCWRASSTPSARSSPPRIAIDSLGGVFAQLGDEATIRHELFRIVMRPEATGRHVGHHGRAHRGTRADLAVRRRGVRLGQCARAPQRAREGKSGGGRSRFSSSAGPTITRASGRSRSCRARASSSSRWRRSSSSRSRPTVRVTSGNAELDRMCGGGFFRDSIILVSGPTGTGKTLW